MPARPDSSLDAPLEEPRSTCAACRRPGDLCYCVHLSPTQTQTRVVVLQHLREARVPLGTLRMLELSLPEAVIRRGIVFEGDPVVEALYEEQPTPYVLYPGPKARDLSEVADGPPLTLIAIDGTWAQAKAVLRRNPRLAALPRVAFTPGAPSIYRIRRQPAEHCVSTVEALARALDVLEGPPGPSSAPCSRRSRRSSQTNSA
ncbi:MAG: DTW domain-containing protein [Planctomycetes bacterium]|nr:DTW domain-containing protein [Planctomycetota bacterium]